MIDWIFETGCTNASLSEIGAKFKDNVKLNEYSP